MSGVAGHTQVVDGETGIAIQSSRFFSDADLTI